MHLTYHIFTRLSRRWFQPIFVLTLIFLFFSSSVADAASVRNRSSYEADSSNLQQDILDSLTDLRSKVNNHEIELRVFEEKFKTEEEIIDSLREQVNNTLKTIRDTLRAQTNTIESKYANNENFSKEIATHLKEHTADSFNALSEYKKRIADLEKTIELQNRNIENIQKALKHVTEILQNKEFKGISDAASQDTVKTYQVKSGDSLEKIAKQNGTSIKKLKEINNLINDQIIIGQKLYLPE